MSTSDTASANFLQGLFANDCTASRAAAWLSGRGKADVNVRDVGSRMQPLHVASTNGTRELVEVLLQRRADLEGRTLADRTPLHYALLYGNAAAASLLVAWGASVRAREAAGKTPLHLAAECRDPATDFGDGWRLANTRNWRGAAEAVLKAKGDLHSRDSSGLTPYQATVAVWGSRSPMSPLLHAPSKQLTARRRRAIQPGTFASRVRAGMALKIVIDADSWQPPIVVEDVDILSDIAELGERYGRLAMVEGSTRKLLQVDAKIGPLQVREGAAAFELLMGPGTAKQHFLRTLEDNIVAVLSALPDAEWKCTSRASARPKHTKSSDQFTLGLLPSRGQRFGAIPMPTPMTWKLPSLCSLLNLYLKLAAPESGSSDVTSIQVLRNFISVPHVDGNNRGCSWGLSFGDYTGGGIWVLDEGGKQHHTLQADVKGPRGQVLYEKGTTHIGRVLDTRRRPQRFDGTLLHFSVALHAGTRYAVVFYCQKVGNERTPGAIHAYLTALGFRLPAEATRRATGTESELVKLALLGMPVKDEPGRQPLPGTRGRKRAAEQRQGGRLVKEERRKATPTWPSARDLFARAGLRG